MTEESQPLPEIPQGSLPRHRFSAAAMGNLGEPAVESSLFSASQGASLHNAKLMLDISLQDQNYEAYTHIKEENDFVAGLGIKVPPVELFFIKNGEMYQEQRKNPSAKWKQSAAHYAGDHETIYLDTSNEQKHGMGKDLTKIFYVHELAHASSYWGPFPKIDKKMGRVHYPAARTGLHTVSFEDKNRVRQHGELLEEAFAYYVQGRYVKEKDLGFKYFIEGATHNDELMAVGMEDRMGVVPLPGSTLMNASLKDKIKIMKDATERGNIIIYPWYFLQGDSPSNYGYNMSSSVGMAFELIIEDDPAFFDALKSARYGTDGLREVAKKLDSLQPGLYAHLRGLEEKPDDIFEFYSAVVDALHRKLSAQTG